MPLEIPDRVRVLADAVEADVERFRRDGLVLVVVAILSNDAVLDIDAIFAGILELPGDRAASRASGCARGDGNSSILLDIIHAKEICSACRSGPASFVAPTNHQRRLRQEGRTT
jgi:hypothetical protein